MSQQLISIVVSAGGIILAAAFLGAIRGVFKVAKAIRDNTEAVKDVQATLSQYIHENDTRAQLIEADIRNLKDWRLEVETTNRKVALGGSTT